MANKILILVLFLFIPIAGFAATKISLAAPLPLSADLDLLITKTRINWRSWDFSAENAAGTVDYLWDFGDGRLGAGQKIKHDFPGSGTYKITLSGSDGAGRVGQTEETITIGFWYLANPYLRVLLGILGLGIIALVVAISFNLFPKYGVKKV